MRANIYLEGAFWATILIPGDSPLATLALGLANQAAPYSYSTLHPKPTIDDVTCTISLSLKPSKYPPPHTEETHP